VVRSGHNPQRYDGYVTRPRESSDGASDYAYLDPGGIAEISRWREPPESGHQPDSAPEGRRNPSADVSMDRQSLRPSSFHGPRIVQSLSRRPHPGTGSRGAPPQSRRHPPRHRAPAGCGKSCKHKTHPASQGDAGINKSASHAAPGFNQGQRRSLRYRCHFAAPFIVLLLISYLCIYYYQIQRH
jgi:hypothetical protein